MNFVMNEMHADLSNEVTLPRKVMDRCPSCERDVAALFRAPQAQSTSTFFFVDGFTSFDPLEAICVCDKCGIKLELIPVQPKGKK